MPILVRHYTQRFAAHFFGSLVILVAFVLIVELLLDLDEILEAQSTLAGILKLVGIRLTAFYLPYLIPVAGFIGAYLTTALASRTHEVTAMKAGGISPMTAGGAILLASAAISLFAFLANETVVRSAQRSLHRDSGDENASMALRHGRIWYHTGRYIYNIENIHGEEVHGVRVFKRDELGRLEQMIEASRGREAKPQIWRFQDATIRTFDPDRPRTPPNIERASQVEIRLAPEESPASVRARFLIQPVWSLFGQAGRGDAAVRATIHRRFSDAPLTFVLVLLAIPLGFSVERTRSIATPALEGMLAISFLFALREYAGQLTASGHGVGMLWMTSLVFLAYAGLRLARTDR